MSSLLIEGMTKENFFRILLAANCGMFQEEKLKSNLCEGECASYYGYKVKEIPLHGRLIDADKLKAKFKKMGLGDNSLIEQLFADGVYTVINNAPAIIEAEEEEE